MPTFDPRRCRALLVALAVSLGVSGALATVSPAGAGIPATCPPSVDTDVEGWVCMLYILELDRSPGDAEVAYWTGIAGSVSRAAVSDGIIFSQESAERYVRDLYDFQVGREVDEGGLAFWSSLLRNRRSELPVELGVFASDEFLGTFLDETEFVHFLYAYYLDRAADDDGLNFWTGNLENGSVSPAQVVSAFQHSSEAGRFVTTLAYAELLGREPDEGGYAHWTPIGAQVGLLPVLAHIATSDEAVAVLGDEGQTLVASDGGAAAAGARTGLRKGAR